MIPAFSKSYRLRSTHAVSRRTQLAHDDAAARCDIAPDQPSGLFKLRFVISHQKAYEDAIGQRQSCIPLMQRGQTMANSTLSPLAYSRNWRATLRRKSSILLAEILPC